MSLMISFAAYILIIDAIIILSLIKPDNNSAICRM